MHALARSRAAGVFRRRSSLPRLLSDWEHLFVAARIGRGLSRGSVVDDQDRQVDAGPGDDFDDVGGFVVCGDQGEHFGFVC